MRLEPTDAAEKLGFDRIREELVRLAQSETGRSALRALEPADGFDEALLELHRVDALAGILSAGDALPECSFESIASAVERAAPAGAYLDPDDLVAVRIVARAARRWHEALLRATGDELRELASRTQPVPVIESSIDELIDAAGQVRDDASPALRRIKREQFHTRERLRGALMSALRRAGAQGWATEDQPTVRSGRMVIPVRAEAKRKVDGLVQDVSATGQTVFIEPSACVSINNEIRDLDAEERREIIRLLTRVTDCVREHAGTLLANEVALTYFDTASARARLALRLKGVVPERADDGVIVLRGARNPVLALRDDYEVVPLDIEMNAGGRLIVITGPNAGGKSVTLKTVGLFAMMLGAGIPVPADPGCRFDRFDQLLSDIGDAQSVDNDLSTYSAHLARMRVMVTLADRRTLVLIDEAGTGTDPDEGAALAQAVLERLLGQQARVLVTTHHGALKRFAHDAEGALNAAMAFDESRLAPTYRFEAGIPGASYAMEIAARMDLDEGLVERARTLLGSERASLEQLLSELSKRNLLLETELSAAHAARTEAENRRNQLADRLKTLQAARTDIRAQALADADETLRGANAEIERAVREIRESGAAPAVVQEVRERLVTRKSEVTQARKRTERRRARPTKSTKRVAPSPGDQVTIDGKGPAGEVVELRGKKAVVTVGSARVQVDVARLTRISGPREQQVSVRRPAPDPSGLVDVRRRIDLRGKRVEEALLDVMRLVDEGLAFGLERVEILHGKGTGALRIAIHEQLEARADIRSFREAHVEEGGAGVTVVTL